MHSEDLLINDGGNGEAVKAVGESLPELDVVSALAFIVETVDTVDRGTLVVSTQNEEVFRVLDLVCKEEADGLEGLLATVDVVTEEEVVSLWWETAIFEETQEVIVLAMDIAADLARRMLDGGRFRLKRPFGHQKNSYLDGRFQFEKNGLRNENLTSLGAEETDL